MRGAGLLDKISLIDPVYIEAADIRPHSERLSRTWSKRRLFAAVLAAVLSLLLIGAGVLVAVYRDVWLESPTDDPVESVRAAIENQRKKEYAIKIKIESIETDPAETQRVVDRFIRGVIADRRGWSDEFLAEHFVVVKAVYYAEYDPALTTRADGNIVQFFYLTRDPDNGEWSIVDNSGNVNWSADTGDDNGQPGISDENGKPSQDTVADRETPASPPPTCEQQLFTYLSDLFNRVYSRYYDGLHYEMRYSGETISGNELTAEFFWTMYFLGKGWDIQSDEGVEQQANMGLQATVRIGDDGMLDFGTIRIFGDSSAKGPPVYDIPLEAFFPTQLSD